MEFLAEYGYEGMFACAFFAATMLPFGSEIVLTVLLASEYDPVLLIAVATLGNVLGSLVNYIVGIRGGHWIMTKLFRLSDSDIATAEIRFRRYGNWSLLFAWVPVVGDPLTVVAGILKSNIWLFIMFVTIGKFIRYVMVAATFMGVWS
ncbi:MAG: DedA family protein [Desulfamplus sp.]|nr:DedA family protein [Desulfamplus sp.]